MGPCCSVYVRRPLSGEPLVELDAYLAGCAERVERTRKGRHWSAWISGRPVAVRVERTEEVLWDCEDDLLELGLLPEDAPFRVVVCAGLDSPEDRAILHRLAQGLSALLDGQATAPIK
jgi:hypothetical protein